MSRDFRKLLLETSSNNKWSNPYKLITIDYNCRAQFVQDEVQVFNVEVNVHNVSNRILKNFKLKISNETDTLEILHYYNIDYDNNNKYWIMPEWKCICGGLSINEIFKFNITVNDDKNIIMDNIAAVPK